MPPFTARVVASIAALPVLMAIYVLIVGLLQPPLFPAFCVADAVCGGLAIIGWVCLWRSSVTWTHDRVRHTIAAGVLAAALALGFGIVLAKLAPREPAALAAGVFGGGCWVLATTWIWRQTPAERLAATKRTAALLPVLCPACGYNLAGLHEARCPECGTRYTLDELLLAARCATDLDEPEPVRAPARPR